MAKRVPIEGSISPQPLQPQAHPVDTYYQPQADPVAPPPKTNGLLQLAESLRAIQPGIDRFVDTKVKQIKDEDLARGAADALKNKEGFNAAIKAGLIPAGASPWYRMGYQEQRLKLIAQDYDVNLRETWATSAVKNSNKPEEFQQFLAQQRQMLLESLGNEYDGKDVSDILMPQLQRSEANLTTHHVSEQMKRIEVEAENNTATLVGNALDDYYKPGLVGQGRSQMLDTLASQILNDVNPMIQSGLSGTKANQLMVDAIATYALDHGDIQVRELLDHINTGNGPLGKTGYAREQWASVEERILANQERQQRFAWAKEDREKEEKIDGLQSKLMLKVIQDPTADISADIKTLAVLDPEKARAVFAFQESRIDSQYTIREDPYLVAALHSGIYSNQTSFHDILMAAANKQIKPDTVSRMLDDLNRFKQDSQTRSMLDNDYIRLLRENLRSAILKGDGFGGFDNDSILRANQADIRFVKAAQQFTQRNQTYEDEALLEHLRKVYQTIIGDPAYTDSSKPIPGSEPAPQSKPSALSSKPRATPKPVSQRPQKSSSATFSAPKFYTTVSAFEAAMKSGEIQKQMADLQVPAGKRQFFIEKMRRYAEIQEQLAKIRKAKGGLK